MAYQIAWKGQTVVFTFHGEVDIQEINKASGTLHGDARFDELKCSIWNLLEADFEKVEMAQIEQPAAIDYAASISVPRMKVALIAQDSSATAEKCARYIKEFSWFEPSWDVRIFNNLEDATLWGNS